MSMPERKFRAQDKYSQQLLDYLWNNADEICTAGPDGIAFNGSLHMLCRKQIPSAQAGDVVNILRESGAIIRVSQAVWLMVRKEVFFDEEGEPIEFEQPISYGHDTQRQIYDRNFQAITSRVNDLEHNLAALTKIVLARKPENEEELHVRPKSNQQDGSSSAFAPIPEVETEVETEATDTA